MAWDHDGFVESQVDKTALPTHGWNGGLTELHNQALLVILMFGEEQAGENWQAAAEYFLPALLATTLLWRQEPRRRGQGAPMAS